MENLCNTIQLANKHTTVSNDEPFMSKLIIYDEGPTSSSNLINSIDMRLSIDMVEMTSLNLSFISNKKTCESIDGFGKRCAKF